MYSILRTVISKCGAYVIKYLEIPHIREDIELSVSVVVVRTIPRGLKAFVSQQTSATDKNRMILFLNPSAAVNPMYSIRS